MVDIICELDPRCLNNSFIEVKTVFLPNNEVFALPIILMSIEYKAVITRIPDKIEGIFNFTCKQPVIQPAIIPAKAAIKRLKSGFMFFDISIALTLPPRAKLPSTVRSAKSKCYV